VTLLIVYTRVTYRFKNKFVNKITLCQAHDKKMLRIEF